MNFPILWGLSCFRPEVANPAGAVAPEVGPNQVNVHGKLWTVVDAVPIDLGNNNSFNGRTSFNWHMINDGVDADYDNRTNLTYFQLFFPLALFNLAIVHTNNNIQNDPSKCGGPTNIGEVVRYLGIRLAMVRDPINGPTQDYWCESYEDANTMKLPRNGGERFKMSRNRFFTIERNFSFNPVMTVAQAQVYIMNDSNSR